MKALPLGQPRTGLGPVMDEPPVSDAPCPVDFKGILDGLVAVGMDLPEACATLWAVGEDARSVAREVMGQWGVAHTTPRAVGQGCIISPADLRRVCGVDAGFANAAFVQVERPINTTGPCWWQDGQDVVALPDDLTVQGALDLSGQPLKHMPRSFAARKLFMQGCPAWDGRFHEATHVLMEVHTDAHPEGIQMDAWQHRYPHGERGAAMPNIKGQCPR